MNLEQQIDERVGEVRTGTLDMSFGEIIGLHKNRELLISPDYQRLFRWTDKQQSRLIESLLLEMPLPPIFVVENDDGRFELIDGLQRISSVIHFIEPTELNMDYLQLAGCDLIDALNGLKFGDLPLRLRLNLKRASVRVNTIKRQSSHMIRYEMFKRLNTGGAILSPQKIRNCTARMIGKPGVDFYTFLKECASVQSFSTCIATLSDVDREQKGDEELVLRFFALKNAEDMFRGSVRDWLDDYMDQVILAERAFNEDSERQEFLSVFKLLATTLGDSSFVKHRDDRPIGGLAPAYFEAVSVGTARALEEANSINEKDLRRRIVQALQTDKFRACTGPGANTKPKLAMRINLVREALTSN